MNYALLRAVALTGFVGLLLALPSDRSSDAKAAVQSSWTSIGPVPFVRLEDPADRWQSGRISSIAVDPRDSNHWLLGVGNGGVWETRDAGSTWSPIADDAPVLAVGAVTFAPSNSSIVYVGTGESAGTGFVHVGVGILKSTNGGQSWSLLAERDFARATVKRLSVHPENPDVLMAATSRGGFGRDSREGAPAPPPFGILKSTDGGNTWVRTLAGQATAFEVATGNFNRQYAAIGDQRLGIIRDTPDAVTNGIYRSSDGGATWRRVDGPWGLDESPNRSTVGRIELAMSPSNPDVVYAGIQLPPNGGANNLGLLGLYRTENAWADTPTWIQVPTDATGPGGYCGPTKCGYSHVLSVDPRDPNTLFAGGAEQGFWRCTSCGAAPAWTNTIRNNEVHSDHHAVAWAGNRLIHGSDGGVWSTTNFGATWQNHNRTLTTTMFYGAALHPTDPSFMLAGARDFPLTVYRGTMGWRVLSQSAAGNWGEAEVAVSTARPATDWMASHLRASILRTTDGGRTAILADAGIDKTGAVVLVAPIRMCPNNDDMFLAGTIRMWRTDNFFNSSAPSWTANSPPRQFPERGFNSQNDPGPIMSIAFVASDRGCNTYAYSTRGGEMRLTRDGGTTWIDLDPSKSLPARPINSLAFDPSAPDRLFAVVSSYNEATPDKPGHIFRTDNAMAASPTWRRIGPPDVPFANMPFNVIAIDPTEPRRVYAGSDNGLWQSTDGGDSWSKVGRDAGMPPAAIYDIKIGADGRTVVFSYGRGAFELSR